MRLLLPLANDTGLRKVHGLRLPQEPELIRVGLDAEALSGPEWFLNSGNFQTRMAVCFGFGPIEDIRYVEAEDMTPGVFSVLDLQEIVDVISEPEVIVVAHNAHYDLDLLNGVLLDNKLPPLPSIQYIDTMNTLKTGRAFRNTLSSRCAAFGVNLKKGSPDWRAVLQRKPQAWDEMRVYNVNDVQCTLELERAYAFRNIPCPVKTWKPRKSGPL